MNFRATSLLMLTLLLLAAGARAQTLEPPLVSTAATTRLDGGSRPWVFITFGENRPGLLAARTLAVYSKTGAPDSAASFVYRGLVTRTSDPSALTVLINRAASLGDDLASLASELEAVHLLLINNVDSANPPVVSPPALPLHQRLSALLNRAAGDTALGAMLDAIGLAHPAVRLARGTAWAGPLDVAAGTVVTLEVRERDASGADAAVMGRVTVNAGQPALLPAPGPLAVVPDTSAGGDLNAKLRWAASLPLRRASSSGVIVWRASRAFAENLGWHTAPPTASALIAAAASSPTSVKRIAGPVMGTILFDAANVANFDPAPAGDPATVFVTDDNDRAKPGGVALPEGTQVYYFAAAVDALGSAGDVSDAVAATFCHRIAPPVPAQVRVANGWQPGAAQRFEIGWMQNTAGTGTSTTRYEVFRGDDVAFHTQANNGTLDLEGDPIVPGSPDGIRRIAVVADAAQVPAVLMQHSDASVPVIESNLGRIWWFAVRAVHEGPPGCGSTASALCPPVFAALRQRAAPAAPSANQLAPATDCLRVACMKSADATDETSATALDPSTLHIRARCQRRNTAIASVQFRVTIASTAEEIVPLTVVEFPEKDADLFPNETDEDFVDFEFTRPVSDASTTIEVQSRAVAFDGSLSRWATSRAPGVTTADHFVLHHFRAGAVAESERLALPGDALWSTLGAALPGECDPDRILTLSPASGAVLPVKVSITFPPRAEEWRLYRRIDDGPLTLVKQDLRGPLASVEALDDSPPTACCTVSYYVQLLDENANASPMALVFTKKIAGPRPPAPLLRQPAPADHSGTSADPVVTLTWVCPPQGVERFEVFVFSKKVLPATTAPEITAQKLVLSPDTQPRWFTTTDKLEALDKMVTRIDRSFLTGRVGADFGAGPKFTLPLHVNPDLEYTVWLRALGACGELGEFSRNVRFHWQPPHVPGQITWPARALPTVGAFHSGITVVDFRDVPSQRLIWDLNAVPPHPSVFTDETPVGIRVGSLDVGGGSLYFFGNHNLPAFYPTNGTTAQGRHDPNSQLYRHATDATQHLLPCVLYRQQVASTAYPDVSGDVVQCSPLIRKIAWSHPDQIQAAAELTDPFFRWVGAAPNDNPKLLELFLIDTQPVVTGARYRYWLLRFDESTGEPVQTVPCGEVTIQSAP